MKIDTPEFLEVYHKDPMVRHAIEFGCSLEEVIIAMSKRHEEMTEKLLKLHAIAPKKFTLVSGKVMVWHAPDHLIPDEWFPR